jgi:excisionase family DNA binding protein
MQSQTSHTAMAEPLLLDIRSAGLLLGLSWWRVYNLARAGELEVIKVGSKFYFRRATLLKWAERAEEKIHS